MMHTKLYSTQQSIHFFPNLYLHLFSISSNLCKNVGILPFRVYRIRIRIQIFINFLIVRAF
jgi:hypothetical protein